MYRQRSQLSLTICGRNVQIVNEHSIKKRWVPKKFVLTVDTAFRISAWERLALTIDEKSFIDWDNDLVQKNPIDFPGYLAKIDKTKEATGLD